MTKAEAKTRLLAGETMGDIFEFMPGQECMIFKAEEFSTGDEIIYIPDIDLNELPVDLDLSVPNSMMDSSDGKWGPMTAEEQVELALSYCYTGKDFVEECEGNEDLARFLFECVDWQHPSSAYPEIVDSYGFGEDQG